MLLEGVPLLLLLAEPDWQPLLLLLLLWLLRREAEGDPELLRVGSTVVAAAELLTL